MYVQKYTIHCVQNIESLNVDPYPAIVENMVSS